MLHELAATADVVVTNYPLRVRDKLRIDHATLAALNERLVYASFTGYGEQGAEVAQPGFDATSYWARSGMMDQVRNSYDATPARAVVSQSDHPSAMTMYAAIVTALYQREHWPVLVRCLEREALLTDERFLTKPDRLRNAHDLIAALEAFAGRERAHWEKVLADNGVVFDIIATPADIATTSRCGPPGWRSPSRRTTGWRRSLRRSRWPMPQLSRRGCLPRSGSTATRSSPGLATTRDRIAALRSAGIVA